MAKILTCLRNLFLGHNIGEIECHLVQESHVRCGEGELYRVRIQSLDATHARRRSCNELLGALDSCEETRSGAGGLGVKHARQGEDHITGGEIPRWWCLYPFEKRT